MTRSLGAALVAVLLSSLQAASPRSYPAQASPGSGERSTLHTLPFATGAVDPRADWPTTDPETKDLVLVQFDRFGEPGMVDRLAATGAGLVQPLAPVSYLVWADREQTRAIREIDGVRWAGVLPPETRLAPSVTASSTRLQVTLIGKVALPGSHRARPRPFAGIRGAVVEIAGTLPDARKLAQLPTVYSVADSGGAPRLRDEQSAQIVAGAFDKANTVLPGYRDFLERIGADGSGVVISHVDGGVDANHPDLSGRVAGCIDYTPSGGTVCEASNSDDAVGHGTHTAGIIVGTASSDLRDGGGFAYGQGVAPGAQLVVQNAINATAEGGRPEAGYQNYYIDAYELGKAIVSANSWGPSGQPQGYDSDTREFDSVPRDVAPDETGDQPMALVFSIMNGRGGTSTQGSPDEGKNIIRVGGSGSRNGPRPQDLCTCTAHGPALDGRLLPDLVAPGQSVISTRATQATLCGLSGSAGEVPPSPLHAPCTGTSMASPHVSGAYALFVDWYRMRHKRTPSPALVKAALVNGAVDLSAWDGVDANGQPLTPIPNNQQGWGRMNLQNTFGAWRQGAVHVDQSQVFTDSKQSFRLRVRAIDPSKPIKATLVWTDALGHGKGGKLPAWVNDLDLRVSKDQASWVGNSFANGWSTPGGKPDRMNNIENVYLRKATRGVFTVKVLAANIIGDGVPNRRGATDQDFALLITNAKRV